MCEVKNNNPPIGWRANSGHLLLFLFPMAGMSVVGWISYIFAFLTLISLSFVFYKQHQLHREERVLITIFFLGFMAFMLSNTVNGWGEDQVSALGVEIRYLLFIPLYLFIRRLADAGKLMIWGFLIGSFVILAQTGYELVIENSDRVGGVYSHIILGPYSVLTLFVVLAGASLFNKKVRIFVVPFAVIAAIIGLTMSGNRGGYVGALVLMVSLLFIRLKGKNLIIGLMVCTLIPVALYKGSELVSHRVDMAVHGVANYIQIENSADSSIHLKNVEKRLEMWKTALLIFSENPMLGTGRWGYREHAQRLVDEEIVHPFAIHHEQPHSAYLEMLVSDGVIGFILFSGMLFFPLFVFLKNVRQEPVAAPLGIILTVGYASFGLTEAAPFIKGNFLSTYLVCLAVFFSWHMQMIHGLSTVPLEVHKKYVRKWFRAV